MSRIALVIFRSEIFSILSLSLCVCSIALGQQPETVAKPNPQKPGHGQLSPPANAQAKAVVAVSPARSMQNQAGIQFSLPIKDDSRVVPIRIQNVPYGVWIEIEGAFYQHKSLDITQDVMVDFEVPQSVLTQSVIIRTASTPLDIRIGDNSKSKPVSLVFGQTVEFDFVREFGDRLSKQPSKSEMAPLKAANVDSSASSSPTVSIQIQGAASVFSLPALPDQLSSIKPDVLQNTITLTAKNTVWEVSPKSSNLLTIHAGTKLLSALAPTLRLKAKVQTSYMNSNKEVVTKDFENVVLEGSLSKARVLDASADRSSIDCQFNFDGLFNNKSEFASYVGGSRHSGVITCKFQNVKLQFVNERFEKDATAMLNEVEVTAFEIPLHVVFPH